MIKRIVLIILSVISISVITISPVLAVDSVILGHDGTSANQGALDYVIFVKALAGSNYIAHSLRVYSAVAGNIKIAIYSGNTTMPINKLASTSGACSGAAYNTFTISDINIVNGQYYWLAFIHSANGVTTYDPAGGVRKYLAATYGTYSFPDTFSNAGMTDDTVKSYVTAMGISAAEPTTVTLDATSITSTGASLNGNITAVAGNATIVGFEWGTTSNGTLPASTQSPITTPYSTNNSQYGNYGVGSFNYSLGSLSANTTYYYRAYTDNFVGWGWGVEKSFTTNATVVASSVSTQSCTGFTSFNAIVNGLLVTDGGVAITQYGFDYGLTTAYGSSQVVAGSLGNNTYYWQNLVNLTPGTVYHYRAKVYNGISWINGADAIFATKGSPVTYEYVNTGGDADSQMICSSNISYQQFTASNISHTITYIRVPLKKSGTPVGTVRVSILHADVANKPTGTEIAYGTMSASTLSTSYVWYQFTLNTELNIQASQSYAVVISNTSDNNPNYVLWQIDTGGSLASSLYGYSSDSGITYTTTASDALFEIWGNSALAVLDAKIFQSYNSSGDWLVCAEIQDTYMPYYPNSDPSIYFTMQLINGSTVVASTPVKQFGRRPMSILLSPANAGALTWGSTNIKVRVAINSTTYSEYAMTAVDWQAGGNTYVDAWVRYIIQDIATYDTSITGTTQTYTTQSNSGILLNSTGGQIMLAAIPTLQQIRPNLFQYVSTVFIPQTVTHTDTFTASHVWSDMFGTKFVSAFTALGQPFGLGGKDFIAMILYLTWAILGAILLSKSHAVLGLAAGTPLLGWGLWMGVIEPAFFGCVAFLAAFLIVRALWLNQAL